MEFSRKKKIEREIGKVGWMMLFEALEALPIKCPLKVPFHFIFDDQLDRLLLKVYTNQ